jgi:hypothetical protein
VAIVTSNVLMITAIKPKGAISRIMSVILPLTIDTEALRTRAVRDEIYIANSVKFSYFRIAIQVMFKPNLEVDTTGILQYSQLA